MSLRDSLSVEARMAVRKDVPRRVARRNREAAGLPSCYLPSTWPLVTCRFAATRFSMSIMAGNTAKTKTAMVAATMFASIPSCGFHIVGDWRRQNFFVCGNGVADHQHDSGRGSCEEAWPRPKRCALAQEICRGPREVPRPKTREVLPPRGSGTVESARRRAQSPLRP